MADKIFIGIDDERIEATGEVLAQILKDREQGRIEAEAKEAARAQKQTILERLGLTEDELRIVLA